MAITIMGNIYDPSEGERPLKILNNSGMEYNATVDQNSTDMEIGTIVENVGNGVVKKAAVGKAIGTFVRVNDGTVQSTGTGNEDWNLPCQGCWLVVNMATGAEDKAFGIVSNFVNPIQSGFGSVVIPESGTDRAVTILQGDQATSFKIKLEATAITRADLKTLTPGTILKSDANGKIVKSSNSSNKLKKFFNLIKKQLSLILKNLHNKTPQNRKPNYPRKNPKFYKK